MLLKDVGKTPAQIKELVHKYMIETYERFDFVCERAEGAYYIADNGDKYLDFYGGVAVNNAGNCNPKVVAAVQEQVAHVMHTFAYPYTIPPALLAEKVCTTLGFDKIYFQSSGTESNEAMIKMARKYGVEKYGPNRYHIISAKKSFHGRTFGSLSATGQPGSVLHNNLGPLMPGFEYAEFNNIDDFKSKVTADTIAIMLEPVQGEGGVWPMTKEFATGIAALCKEKGLLLLLDEIQTGWFRTGPAMAFMDLGVKPDALTMAKGIGGGMPIGAVVATDEVAQVFGKGAHGTTYGANAVCCAAALAQLDVMIGGNYEQKVREISAYFVSKLEKLPRVKEVRGKGLLVGMQLDGDIGLAVKKAALARKLMTTAIGTSIIRMVPPLIVTKEECDQAVSILEESIKSV